MLARAHRLRQAADFTSVVRRGARAGSPVLVVHLLPPDPDSGSHASARAGFLVSRAVGDAVTRNRVVRRLRHLAGQRLAELPAGSRVVVRALPTAAAATSAELGAALDGCLDRARRRGVREST